MVVHPNNPTGHYTSADELAKLNEICVKHELAIIADEVFLDFALTPRAGRAATFAHQRRCAHLHHERHLENFRLAANESGVAHHKWPGGREVASS